MSKKAVELNLDNPKTNGNLIRENIENGIIREDCNPELLAKEYYSFPIYLLLEICAKYDDIPESTLENFFEEAEEHANFLLDCVKVK